VNYTTNSPNYVILISLIKPILYHSKEIMKKLIALLLLTFYTAATFGVTLNFHYCGGYLDHVTVLNFSDKGACSCNPDIKPKGCCQDKTVYHKTDDHKKIAESYSFNNMGFSVHFPLATDPNKYNLWAPNGDKNYFFYQVRRSGQLPIYLCIRSLRI